MKVDPHLPNCLASLGQSAREAIDLRYRAQLRMAAIAERLKRSEGAIKQLQLRGVRNLAKLMPEGIRG